MKQKIYLLAVLLFSFSAVRLKAQCNYYVTIATSSVSDHSFGITADGQLWAWGSNGQGQLGNGTTGNGTSSPIRIGTATNWKSIAAGKYHSLGITTDGELWAWGLNAQGQLGDGTTDSRNSPTRIGTATNWKSVAAGRHSLAITTDGQLWAWGANSRGQLGNGEETYDPNPVPIRIGTATNWKSIAAGEYFSIAITTDGQLWAWGAYGFSATASTPTRIDMATNWVSIAAGAVHSLAINADGELWAWGSSYRGQTGVGHQNSPARFGTATNWVSIAGGGYTSAAINADGELWAWGWDNAASVQITNPPAQIGTATNWVGIAGGNFHNVAMTNDGQLWAWGWNGSGSLGNGTTSNSSAPILVNNGSSILATTGSSVTRQQESGQYTLYNNGCALIAAVRSVGAAPVSGVVTAKVWIEDLQPAKYVKRHYEINPATNAANATGRVTLYFTQEEFNAFNQANDIDLPTPDNLANISNLLIEKRPGMSNNDTGLPDTYTTGIPETIDPVDTDIIWNSTASRWEVTFDVSGFSGFFVKTSDSPLPVGFGGINAVIKNSTLIVDWQTLTETNNDRFEIEASQDGINFTKMATIASKAEKGNSSSPLQYSWEADLGMLASFSWVGIALLILLLPVAHRYKKQLLMASVFLFIAFISCSKQADISTENPGGKYFIRIAQVDKDGGKTYSKIVGVVN